MNFNLSCDGRDPDALLSMFSTALTTKPNTAGAFQGARTFQHGLPNRRIQFFPSKKNGGLLQCESRLERDHLYSLERSPEIESFRTQPLTIRFDERFYFTVDVAARCKDGRLRAIEVKPAAKLQNLLVASRIRHLRKLLAACQISLDVETEDTLPPPAVLDNIKALYHRADTISAVDQSLVRAFFNGCAERTLSCLRSYLASVGRPAFVADALVWGGLVRLDLSKPIGPNSPVSLSPASLQEIPHEY